MTNYIRKLRGKKSQNQHLLSFLIKKAIENFFRRNLVRQWYDPFIEVEAFEKYL